MDFSKPTTRTVAQRRVYGKRKNNAPRAVFDEKSPARETCKAIYLERRRAKIAAQQEHGEELGDFANEVDLDEDAAAEKFFDRLRTKERYATDVFT